MGTQTFVAKYCLCIIFYNTFLSVLLFIEFMLQAW